MEDGVGEHYVTKICHIFQANGRDLHAGRVTLCLTATCVEYITRKSSILQIGNITEPPQSQHWRNLPLYLQSVKAVKLIEDRNIPLKSPISLDPFKYIHTLVLKRLPVNLVLGLQRLRQQLKTLVVERCLNDIDDALVFCGGDNATGFRWTSLVDLNLSHNSISSLGDALKYLTAVQRVDLSDNQVSDDHNGIQYVDTATFLHLGFNRLVCLPIFGPRAKYHLTVLCVRNNNLDSLDGVEHLERLIELDAADNCISEHKKLVVLATLHHLTTLCLSGNPLSSHSYYRKETCTYLSSYLDPKMVKLDGSHLSTAECKLLAQRNISTVTVVTPEQAIEQVFSVVIPGSGYITPEGDVESATPKGRSPRMKRKKRKARKVNLSDSEDPLSSTGHTPKKDSTLKHYERRKKQERMRKELQSKWLTVANLEENNSSQAVSNVETADEVEQQQPTQQFVGSSSRIVNATNKSEKATTKVGNNDGPLADYYGRFDEEESFLVRFYDSDTEEPSSMERLYVCLSDRFLEERNFGSGKVIDKLDLNCLQSATISDMQSLHHKTCFKMVLHFSYERRDRRKREYVMQDEQETQRLLGTLLPVIQKNKTEVALNTKMECLECHSIIDSKHVIMKESNDSVLPPLSTMKGIANPLRTTVTSPHFMERQCPYCDSTSIVEKTSLGGSVPNYSPNIWTDSVLIRSSPAHSKSPTNSSASSRAPVMTHRVQKEFVVEVTPSQPKEERGISTPVFTSYTSNNCEVYQPNNGYNDDTIEITVNTTSTTHKVHQNNDGVHLQNGIHQCSVETHKQNDEIVEMHPQNDELHQHNVEICQQNKIHQCNVEIHQQNNKMHQHNDEMYQQINEKHQQNDEVRQRGNHIPPLNVIECKIVTSQKYNSEISTPIECEDHEELVLNKPSAEEHNLKCDESSEVSFEATFGSLPNKEHAFPKSKASHNRSRSMDLQGQKLDPKRTNYSQHLSGMSHKGDELENNFAASLLEYATQKKLLKSSEASLDSSFSGTAAYSDNLIPMRNTTLSSSDSRSVTPTGVPYSMDDPMYIHNSFKLYLNMKVFEDTEEFQLLLRCSAVTFGQLHEFACLLLVTDQFMYICQVVAPVSSSPSKWLKFLHRHSLKHLEFIEYGLGYQSFTIEFSPPENVWYKMCPQDQRRCQDFVERLTRVVSDVNDCKLKGIKTHLQSMTNLRSQVFQKEELSQEEIYGNWLMDALKQTSNVIRDHLVYIRSYPQCFAGQDLVQWFTEREEYNTKNGVCVICQRLLNSGVICSLDNDEEHFEDNHRLYRFAADHHKHSISSQKKSYSYQSTTTDEQEGILELFLLGKWLKTGTLSQLTVAVVISSTEIFLVQENPFWPLPRHAKLPSLGNIPPQFTVLQQRKINEIHYITLDCDQPHHVTVAFFSEDLADADFRSWLLIFETEMNARNLTKTIKVCWEAEFGIDFEIRNK